MSVVDGTPDIQRSAPKGPGVGCVLDVTVPAELTAGLIRKLAQADDGA